MEHWQLRERWIRRIPRHTANDLEPGERVGIILVALLGLTGILGTLVAAWWIALT